MVVEEAAVAESEGEEDPGKIALPITARRNTPLPALTNMFHTLAKGSKGCGAIPLCIYLPLFQIPKW